MGSLTAAILAGGKSLRMGGRHKAFLALGGRSILQETIARLEPLFDELIIVGPEPTLYSSYGLPVHRDLRPGSGSLGGILSALGASASPSTLCVACDMPFLSTAVISRILDEAGRGWEAVVPRLPEGIEPLCALYSSSLVPRIESLLDGGERRIRALLDLSRTLYIGEEELRPLDPGLTSFFNINTPEDLDRARRLREAAP